MPNFSTPDCLIDVGPMYEEYMENLRSGIEKAIINKFIRSNELAAYVGGDVDQEVINVFIRSVKVKFSHTTPPKLEISFDDDFGHWYDGELSEELRAAVNKMMADALSGYVEI